jgi:DNA-binding IclR family transcriptional regulator
MLTTMTSTPSRQESRPGKQSVLVTASVIERVQAEYAEMPGLSLTLPQAARLWALSAPQTERLLSTLVESGFLRCNRNGLYRRRR